MPIDERGIITILVKEGYVSAEKIELAIQAAKKNRVTVLNYLITENIISFDIVGQAIAENFGVPYADLNTNVPTAEQVLKIPENIAKKFNVVLFKETNDNLILATDDPKNPAILENIKAIFPGKKINLAYALFADIAKSFFYYKKELSQRFSNILKTETKVAPEMITEIVSDALELNASDIHFEPKGEQTEVRFRVDGILHKVGQIPTSYYDNIVNYLKVLSSLRIDEHRATQDGAVRIVTKTGQVDARLSIVPVVGGEKIVLRVLSRQIGDLSIETLGLSKTDQEIFEMSIQKPFGMVIISGPTGSGKTTTLYALIKKINTPEVNVTSIEDPVEYIIDDANQIQVNNETGITFARGLRSIVRQDPNVILVGEIRDRETAEISINAALTGHLLFTTFHANNAATTFLRLAELGIEKYLLASTVELVASQRLLRQICQKCRYSHAVDQEYLSKHSNAYAKMLSGTDKIYLGKGCPACNGTGYKGRIAVFEIIKMSPEIQDLIMNDATSQAIWEQAMKQGSHSLHADALKKAQMGITTFEEVFRVAPPTN